MKNIVRCRSCRQMRWRNDPCPSVSCNSAPPVQRSVRASAGSVVQASRFNGGTHYQSLSTGPRLLTGEQYVADVDGRHFIAGLEV